MSKFYDDKGGIKDSTVFQKVSNGADRVSLKSTVKKLQETEKAELQHFHVTKHRATGLARSDNRDAKMAADIAGSAEVVLAFQLTESSEPVDEKQKVFAFLPIRKSNFRVSFHLSESKISKERSLKVG